MFQKFEVCQIYFNAFKGSLFWSLILHNLIITIQYNRNILKILLLFKISVLYLNIF